MSNELLISEEKIIERITDAFGKQNSTRKAFLVFRLGITQKVRP